MSFFDTENNQKAYDNTNYECVSPITFYFFVKRDVF